MYALFYNVKMPKMLTFVEKLKWRYNKLRVLNTCQSIKTAEWYYNDAEIEKRQKKLYNSLKN
jgi:hypothetical protein